MSATVRHQKQRPSNTTDSLRSRFAAKVAPNAEIAASGRAVEYICYIDRERSDVPFMDIVHADTLADARDIVRILMSQRSDSLGARLYVGDDLVETLPTFWGAIEAQA